MEPIPGPTTARFQQLATRYNCYIALGLPEVDPATQVYYNSAALLGPEGLVGTYRKIHSSVAEPHWARDGDLGMPVWETPLGHLSMLISMDANNFEAARVPALRHADVILFLTNWDSEKCPSSWWMARAFENGVYMIAANRYGHERGLQFGGGSSILNPDGSLQCYQDNGRGIVYGEIDLAHCRNKEWGSRSAIAGDRLADRRPAEYITLVNNSYLWEPLRYHRLYERGELPEGQLSCVGFIQTGLKNCTTQSNAATIELLQSLIPSLISDSAPACPDLLVLPELILPGPILVTGMVQAPATTQEIIEHFQQRAIQVPGPETDALVALADELQISMVIGVAERAHGVYYNTILLLDPEGIYGTYRKLHLTRYDQLWATPGNLGLATFDTPSGRIGLATGYDVLFPETLRVLAGMGADLVCAPAFLDFPDPIGLAPTSITHTRTVAPERFDPEHYLLWRVCAAEHNVYLALVNWSGRYGSWQANGSSGIFPPTAHSHPRTEVVADEEEPGMMMMTIDTREQRTGRRTTRTLEYTPGAMAGSLTGELAYDKFECIPGNAVRSKPLLRKRQPFWYLEVAISHDGSKG